MIVQVSLELIEECNKVGKKPLDVVEVYSFGDSFVFLSNINPFMIPKRRMPNVLTFIFRSNLRTGLKRLIKDE